MATRHFALIVNPRAGARRSQDILDRVRSVLASAGTGLDVCLTEYPGHATQLAKTLDLKRYAGLCVIGGDGTIHEVVNGLMQRDEPNVTPLGVLPGGTGNSVLFHLGSASLDTAVQRILARRTLDVDLARVTTREQTCYSVNIIGWGGVVDINRTAEKLRLLGRPRYNLAALWHVLFPRRRRARLQLDDQIIDDEFLFVVGCNTRFTGRGMLLAPRADIGDGKIDVVVARRLSRAQMLRLLRRVLDGTHAGLDGVEYHQVRSFSIASDSEQTLNIDGELKGRPPVTVQVLPRAVRLFA